jgi:hypothetical protein
LLFSLACGIRGLHFKAGVQNIGYLRWFRTTVEHAVLWITVRIVTVKTGGHSFSIMNIWTLDKLFLSGTYLCDVDMSVKWGGTVLHNILHILTLLCMMTVSLDKLRICQPANN